MIKQYYKHRISIVGTLAILMSIAFILTGYADERGDKQSTDTNTTRPVKFLFKNNHLDYQPIGTPTKFHNKDFKLPFLGLAKDDTFLYIKLIYDSPIRSRVGVRLAGDAPGLWEFMSHGTKIGKNLLIIQLESRKVVTYPDHICVEIGDGHSVVIEKEIVDFFISGRRSFAVKKDIAQTFKTDTRKSVRFLFKNNNLDYQPIGTRTEFYNKDFKLTLLGLAKDDTFLYIKLVYVSPIRSRVGVRLAGDAPGLKKFLTHGTKIGKNLLIIKLETKKVATYPTHICVEIGDDHSVVIDKDIVDDFITDTPKSIRFFFKDNNLDYQSIRTPTDFENKDFKLTFMGLAKDDTHLYIKLEYNSPVKSSVGVRLAGDKDVSDVFDAWKFLPYGTKVGKNLFIIQLETKKVLTYPTHICVEIGDDRSVVIKKDIVDAFIMGN
ncbi:hypothetical protein ACFL5Z_14845 [Planctomycetota bacterium]